MLRHGGWLASGSTPYSIQRIRWLATYFIPPGSAPAEEWGVMYHSEISCILPPWFTGTYVGNPLAPLILVPFLQSLFVFKCWHQTCSKDKPLWLTTPPVLSIHHLYHQWAYKIRIIITWFWMTDAILSNRLTFQSSHSIPVPKLQIWHGSREAGHSPSYQHQPSIINTCAWQFLSRGVPHSAVPLGNMGHSSLEGIRKTIHYIMKINQCTTSHIIICYIQGSWII